MTAAYHLTEDWTHWLFAGFVVVATIVGLVGIFLSVKPEPRPYDWEIDGECSPSETHVKLVPYAYDEIVWPSGPQGPAYHRSWRK